MQKIALLKTCEKASAEWYTSLRCIPQLRASQIGDALPADAFNEHFNKAQKIAVVGPVTKDIIEICGKKQQKTGGTVYHTSYALHNLGADVTAFAKLSKKDTHILDSLSCKKIKVWSEETTVFRNIYPEKNSDYREQIVESVSCPFSVDDVRKARRFDIVHLGPLNKTDMPLDVIKCIRKNNLLVSLDVQGFLRKIVNKKVYLEDWAEKEALEYVDIIKCDVKEARILTGKKSVRKSAESIGKMGPKEVVITCGSKGSLIYSAGKAEKIKASKPGRIIDATGAGDAYMAGYLFMRLKAGNAEKCGRFASNIAALRIEGKL